MPFALIWGKTKRGLTPSMASGSSIHHVNIQMGWKGVGEVRAEVHAGKDLVRINPLATWASSTSINHQRRAKRHKDRGCRCGSNPRHGIPLFLRLRAIRG